MTINASGSVESGDILVIDDDPMQLRVMSAILSKAGLNVRTSGNDADGLNRAFATPPSLVILDMSMPGTSGLDLCRILKNKPDTRDIPVIFCTGLTNPDAITNGFNAGAVDFVRKPYLANEIIARVKVHLDLRRTQCELERSFLDLKQSEESLRNAKEYAENIIKTANTIVVSLDVTGKVIEFNEAAEKITGYSKADLVNRDWFEVLVPRDRYPEVWEEFVKLSIQGFSRNFENPILTKTGEERYIVWQNSVAYDHGKTIGTISFGLDITERRKAEEQQRKMELQLHQTQKLESLGVLAGGIAHDFNNLLGGIFGYMDLALDVSDPNGKSAQYLVKALKTYSRAKDLTQQLLTFAKGGAPAMTIGPLVPLLRETTGFALSGSKVSCLFEIDDNLGLCEFDVNQLGQVIDNIVINAIQAMPLGGTLTVAVKSVDVGAGTFARLGAGRHVRCSFTDTGIGIPADILPRIFDPFFTTKQKGNGLGLATAYSIIQKHNGEITVESIPGKGTTFHIYMPETKKCLSTEKNTVPARHKGTGIILIMDDEEYIREIVGEMVQAMGYSVEWAENGQQVIDSVNRAVASGKTYRAIIMDLTIPGGMGGGEAIKVVRELVGGVPVFVASGYSDDPVMADPAAFGFTGKIGKPFRVSELMKLFQQHLSVRKNRHRR